jgi:Ca2+-dependent lipid-binding protein
MAIRSCVLTYTTLITFRKLKARKEKKLAVIKEMLKELKTMDKLDQDEKKAEVSAVDAVSNDVTTKKSAEFDNAHRQQFPSPYFKVCSLRHLQASVYLAFACMIDHDTLFILWYV